MCPDVALIEVVSVSIYFMLRVDQSHKLISQPRERLYNVIPSKAGTANGPDCPVNASCVTVACVSADVCVGAVGDYDVAE